jgi:hypothetical protein
MSNPYGLLVQARPSEAIAGGTPRPHGERLRLGAAVRAVLARLASFARNVAAHLRRPDAR